MFQVLQSPWLKIYTSYSPRTSLSTYTACVIYNVQKKAVFLQSAISSSNLEIWAHKLFQCKDKNLYTNIFREIFFKKKFVRVVIIMFMTISQMSFWPKKILMYFLNAFTEKNRLLKSDRRKNQNWERNRLLIKVCLIYVVHGIHYPSQSC